MEKYQLDRLMRIAQKTNSPVIVLDEGGNEMVVLPLNAYEELIDSYSDEDFELSEEFYSKSDFQGLNEEFESEEQLDEFEIEASGVNIEELSDDIVKENPKIEDFSPENSTKIDAEPAEEQFYLEPVE